MRRGLSTCLLAFAVAAPATVSTAQAIDSISVALDTRYRWRSYDRGDGLTARSAVSLALGGFSTSQAPGDRNNWRFDLTAINPLAHRDLRGVFDQYEASLSYGRCLSACSQGEWIKRLTLNSAAKMFHLPGAAGDRTTPELEVTLRGYAAIEKIGTKQVGANLYPFITVAHDLQRYRATYARIGTGTYLGPVGAFGISLDGALAMSDWPASDGAARSFGFHGADFQLGVDHDRTVGDRHLSTRLTWGLELPAGALGADVGLVMLRFKLTGPVLMLR